MGVPVRIGYLVYLGFILAGALGLARLRAIIKNRLASSMVVLIPGVMSLVEYSPRQFIETSAAIPKPMLAWAKNPAPFSVLDISGDYRMMWHAMLHRHPIIGGNLTRIPERLEKWYWGLPIVRALRDSSALRYDPVFKQVDPEIDFSWKKGSPNSRLNTQFFRVEWTGSIIIPCDGEWAFQLSSDDGSRLEIDNAMIIDNGGVHPMQTREGKLALKAGEHKLRLFFEQRGGGWGIDLKWQGPNQPWQIIPREMLRTSNGQPGLNGAYFQGWRDCNINRIEGRQALHGLGVRYLVTGDEGSDCVSLKLGLPEIYRGDGIRIFEAVNDL